MFDEEIEKAMLFYIIFKHEKYELKEKDFMNAENKKIIKAINKLNQKKQEISMLTIKNEIDDNSSEILSYLATLSEFIENSNAETIYKILKDYTKKREVYDLAKMIQIDIEEKEDVDLFIERLIAKLHNIEFQTNKEEDFIEQIVKTIENIEKSMTEEKSYDLHTGFFNLDAITDGLHNRRINSSRSETGCWKNNICITNSRKNSK